jgi:hypothetical protein
VTNTYVAGPALFPTVGSPNPMLTGIALCRRLADHLTASAPFVAEPDFTALFDGADARKWRMSTIRRQPGRDNPGSFLVVGGALETVAGNDMGLLWHTDPIPDNFQLILEWRRWRPDGEFVYDNSGVFFGFPHLDSKGYDNTAFVARDLGFEVQIDELAHGPDGRPSGNPIYRTGAIYNLAGPHTALAARGPGQWNEFDIRAETRASGKQLLTVALNGTEITRYEFDRTQRAEDAERFLPGRKNYLGLQVYANGTRMAFRRIRIKPLLVATVTPAVAAAGAIGGAPVAPLTGRR